MTYAAGEARELVFAILALDKDAAPALRFQIYLRLRDSILSGRLPAGTRLPSTRQIAQHFAISRTTASAALDMLIADGLVEARTGSGTYVCAIRQRVVVSQSGDSWEPISKSGQRMRNGEAQTHRAAPRCFVPAMPSLDEFPVAVWSQLTGRVLREQREELLSYAQAGGYEPLREAIAARARFELAIECEPEQVVIVDGSQQAIDILARLFLDPGDDVWIEDPAEQTMALALAAAGAQVHAVGVDRDGMRVEEGIAGASRPRLIHVTPIQQWPLGSVLSHERRERLLSYATACDAFVVEDDFNSEFRFSGAAPSSLMQVHPTRVIRLSTFSLTLFPGLRLGYMIVPPGLIDPVLAAKRIVHRQSGLLQQGVLARFMHEGHFGAHVRRMHQTYAQRREAILALLQSNPLPGTRVRALDCGLHVVLEFDDAKALERFSVNARSAGVIVPPISEYTRTPALAPCALLGFGGVPERDISRGIRALRNVRG